MSLAPGARLGPYEIIAPLGKGGMGEVLRARDTKLDREVAIKVLPAALARDAERLARFEREAKVLASLNHPHIATIYSLEDAPGGKAIAMELVEGETLNGPMAVEEAVRLAVQIAEALEAAHEKGVTHRDLKPANIMVNAAGQVKVLDFGLAAVDHSASASGSGKDSPTLTIGMTTAGTLLGTAAYMAPEQAAAKAVDKRADIWSFGVVLYEMLTGQRLFDGETVADTLADVLRAPIRLDGLPAGTGPGVRRLLERCLQRDPKRRLRDIGEARIALSDPELLRPAAKEAAPRTSRRPALMAAVGIGIVLVAGSGWMIGRMRQSAPGGALTRFTIELPAGTFVNGGAPAISRDGSLIVYGMQNAEGLVRLHSRKLDQFASKEIPGTEGASHPFLSPDGSRVGYFAGGKLMVTALEGGSPSAISDSTYLPLGGTWGPDDQIYFVPKLNGGILRVSASGGKAEQLTDPFSNGDAYAHTWPEYLHDSHALLFSVWGGVGGMEFRKAVLPLGGGKPVVVRTMLLGAGRYAKSGHLLTSNTEGIVASRFNPDSPKEPGNQSFVVEDVFSTPNINLSWYAVSDNGTLVYVPGDPRQCTLALADGSSITPLPGKPQPINDFALSPDGKRLAVENDLAIWMHDLERGTKMRLTGESDGQNLRMAWSRDGSRLYFSSNRGGDWDIYSVAANGGPAKRVLARPDTQFPQTEAPDGTLLFSERTRTRAADLWTVAPDGTQKPLVLSTGASSSVNGQFSPDGRMVAYVSNESGRNEVYVRLVARPEEVLAISAEGGLEASWSPDGRQLYYRRGNEFLAVSITPGVLAVGKTVKLFETKATRSDSANFIGYAVRPDGKLLIRMPDPRAVPTKLHVVLNWFEELKAKVPR